MNLSDLFTPNAEILILVAFLSGYKEGAAVSEIVQSLPEGDKWMNELKQTYIMAALESFASHTVVVSFCC